MNAEELINQYLSGSDIDDLIESVLEEPIRRSDRPRKRRFSKLGKGFDPVTGKRKDPKRRMIARKTARRFRSKRRAAQRKFHKSAKGKLFHKRLGRLSARLRR